MRLLLPLLVLAAPALCAQTAVTAWPEPEVATDGFTLCTSHGGDRVCRRPSDDGPGLAYTVEHGGRETGSWDVSGGLAYGFTVFGANLDGDGAVELIVANNDGVSNGMGVAYWTLYVLGEDRTRPASVIPVREFGPNGESFAEDGDGLVLWATEWLSGPDPSGRRGEGLYFVGRPFRFEDGRLVPAADLPIRARRFLDSFAEVRGSGPADPTGWLSDRRAETRSTDPYLDGHRSESFRGVVASVTPVEAEFGATNWVIRVETPDGEAETFTYAGGYSEGLEQPFTYFGDAASGRLFPALYRPFTLTDWLLGRTVRADSYDTAYEPRRVLWLE